MGWLLLGYLLCFACLIGVFGCCGGVVDFHNLWFCVALNCRLLVCLMIAGYFDCFCCFGLIDGGLFGFGYWFCCLVYLLVWCLFVLFVLLVF